MKAVLVIDMPKSCADCQIMADKWCYGIPVDEVQYKININERPKWCPLKPLPQEKDVGYPNEDYDVGFGDGWDACLKEIEG